MDPSNGLMDLCPGNLQGVDGFFFLTLLNSLLAGKCNLGRKENYQEDYSPLLKDEDEFDFIVIGSGSAGSVVANKLSENKNWKILVLEAGGYPSATSDIPALLFSLQTTDEDWQYKFEPSETSCLGFKDKQCRCPRGKVLGGSSTLNAMVYLKGNKRDYDHWAELGNNGWDWDSVQRHFKELEKVQGEELSDQFGRKGYLDLIQYDPGEPIQDAINDGFELLGYPKIKEENSFNPLGVTKSLNNMKNGIRMSAAKAFLGKIKERKNIFTSLNSYVQKILIDSKKKTATGVQVKIGEKILKLKAKKEVIVSGGTINSPQLLMLSGIGPKTHLESLEIELVKDLPVGENLEDHAVFTGFHVSLSPDAIISRHPLDDTYQYFAHQKGLLSTVGVTNTLAFVNTKNDSSKYPNLGYHFLLHPPNDQYLIPEYSRVTGFNDEIFESRMGSTKNGPGLMIVPTLLNPKSKGKILLKSKNPDDQPSIHSGFLTDQVGEDIQTLLEGIRFAEKLIETKPVKKFNPNLIKMEIPACEKFEPNSEQYWICSLRHLTTTIYHVTGTCKMGAVDDGSSVVDSRLRVHGVKYLRVVDASIMPKIVSANTQAAAMMIGHKAGVMISEDWSEEHHEEL